MRAFFYWRIANIFMSNGEVEEDLSEIDEELVSDLLLLESDDNEFFFRDERNNSLNR